MALWSFSVVLTALRLAATTQTCVRNKRAILVADLWGSLAAFETAAVIARHDVALRIGAIRGKAAGMVLWPPSAIVTGIMRDQT